MTPRWYLTVGAALLAGLAALPLSGADLAAARAALDRDDNKVAVAIAEKAVAEDPTNVEGWIVLGHGLSGQIDQAGMFQKADLAKRSLAAYTEAATRAPRNVEAHVSLLEYYRQAPALVGGSRAKAIQQAETLVALDAGLGNSWLVRLALEDGRLEDAANACEAMVRAEPNSYRTLYWLGANCASSGKQLARGEDALRRALLMGPGPDDPGLDEANTRRGELREKAGDRAGAVSAYKAALAINPKHPDARARLAALRE